MARAKGCRNILIRITYDDIGELAGLAGDTAKQYAHRGQYDPHCLRSVLGWINHRRVRRGLSPIGLPKETPAGKCSQTME